MDADGGKNLTKRVRGSAALDLFFDFSIMVDVNYLCVDEDVNAISTAVMARSVIEAACIVLLAR
jgi:hypothetical protein